MEKYIVSEIDQYSWEYKGNISVAGSALDTNKSAATVHALAATTFIRIQPDPGTIAINLRWRGGSDGNVNIQNLYAMRGDDDHYTRIAVITLTTGLQSDGTHLFVDTVASASDKWTDAIVDVSDGADGIGHLSLNTHGYKNFLLLGTTVVSTLHVDMARE